MTFAEAVDRELARARGQHAPIASAHEGLAVVLEEYRELEREVFDRTQPWGNAAKELVQLAAMCRRMVEDLGWMPLVEAREEMKDTIAAEPRAPRAFEGAPDA